MIELADRLRILLGEPSRDLTRATLRGARACHRAEARRPAAGTLAGVRRLEIEREMDPDAIASVRDLLAEAERADGHRPLSDHLWLDLVSGGRAASSG